MPQKQIKVLISSAGTASAISFIKAIKYQTELDISIIAVDMDILAPGLHLADKFFLVPKANSPYYIDELLRVCKQENVSVLIPIYSKEIAIVAAHKERFKEAGVCTLLPNHTSIEMANDKHAMSIIAVELGIVSPKTSFLIPEINLAGLNYPVFVKPNSSSSSAGTEKVNESKRLEEIMKQDGELIIQDYIEGQEVTVDVLCNYDCEPIIIAPRLRLATKSGQSVKGITIEKERFVGPVTLLCKRLHIVGSCNIQFFITKENELVFIELNPRYAAGGLMLTVKAGANIPLQVIKVMLNLPVYKHDCNTKVGISMTRYWEEIILDENNKTI